MEIMGLAIVVILVTLAFLFAVVFFIGKEDSQAIERSRNKVFAENWVHTFLGTTSGYKRMEGRELVQNCVRGQGAACNALQSLLQDTLDRTLITWNKQFYVSIIQNNADIITEGQPCKGEQDCGHQEVPMFGYDVQVQICICV